MPFRRGQGQNDLGHHIPLQTPRQNETRELTSEVLNLCFGIRASKHRWSMGAMDLLGQTRLGGAIADVSYISRCRGREAGDEGCGRGHVTRTASESEKRDAIFHDLSQDILVTAPTIAGPPARRLSRPRRARRASDDGQPQARSPLPPLRRSLACDWRRRRTSPVPPDHPSSPVLAPRARRAASIPRLPSGRR